MSKRKIHKYIEKSLIEMVMEMGAESLNPDQYSQLEDIKNQLLETRNLSDPTTPPQPASDQRQTVGVEDADRADQVSTLMDFITTPDKMQFPEIDKAAKALKLFKLKMVSDDGFERSTIISEVPVKYSYIAECIGAVPADVLQRVDLALHHIKNGCLVPPDGGSPTIQDYMDTAEQALALLQPYLPARED